MAHMSSLTSKIWIECISDFNPRWNIYVLANNLYWFKSSNGVEDKYYASKWTIPSLLNNDCKMGDHLWIFGCNNIQTKVILILFRYEFLDISNRISVRLRNVMYKQILQRDFYKQHEIPQTFVHHLITDIKTVS